MPSTNTLFDFRDASFSGDPKWGLASPRFALHAPKVVLVLALLSIIEVVIGIVWIVNIQSLANGWGSLTFPQVIQPLVVPALSFFNTIPSLHLHILARSNQPLMALIFSTLLALTFLGSAIVFLPPCVGADRPVPAEALENPSVTISGYQRTECPSNDRRGLWGIMVALQFVSFAGYAVHAAMAWAVWRGLKKRDRDIRSGNLVEMVDEVEKARREEDARQRWREMGNL
ncbi:hypothetical protein LTR64_007427 [Lithohypha guttulata]|uniref:uncharacterized protein n=1 Tax=Lithohypha guttulata TaxID=1690604 RepID=UPI002DDEDA12|nr:hypothetical protein LTR51_006808 [Lithohypha guttulata]